MKPGVRAVWIGRRRYGPVHELMRELATLRTERRTDDIILLVEHDPVVTLGRSADPKHVLWGASALASRGIDLVQTGRGGDVTYHGPGQLVAYPILDLKPDRCDVRRYVRSLAEAMVLIAREHHVETGVVDGMIGVWADADSPTEWAGAAWARRLAKVGAIGVRISRWVTSHGFALNLSVDPSAFAAIVPCGIRTHAVTSIRELTGRALITKDVALAAAPHLARALEVPCRDVEDMSGVNELRDHLASPAA